MRKSHLHPGEPIYWLGVFKSYTSRYALITYSIYTSPFTLTNVIEALHTAYLNNFF